MHVFVDLDIRGRRHRLGALGRCLPRWPVGMSGVLFSLIPMRTTTETTFIAWGYDFEFEEEREERFTATDEATAVETLLAEMPWAEYLGVHDPECAGSVRTTVWERNPTFYLKSVADHATSLDEVIAALTGTADELRAYKEQGFTLDCVDTGHVRLLRPEPA